MLVASGEKDSLKCDLKRQAVTCTVSRNSTQICHGCGLNLTCKLSPYISNSISQTAMGTDLGVTSI